MPTDLLKMVGLIKDVLDWKEVANSKGVIKFNCYTPEEYQGCKAFFLNVAVIKDCGEGKICRHAIRYNFIRHYYFMSKDHNQFSLLF